MRTNPPDPTDYEAWEKIVLLATGSQEQASRARRKAKENWVDSVIKKRTGK